MNFQAKDDLARFYTLNTLATGTGCGGTGKIIGLTRVIVPDYLDREKIVTEIQVNELYIASHQYWAESLSRGITRVMTENLSTLLPRASVLPAPWQNFGTPDLELRISILDFKPQMYRCETSLLARYAIMDLKDSTIVCSEEVCISVPLVLGNDCYIDIAQSMSEALCQLSQRIASRL